MWEIERRAGWQRTPRGWAFVRLGVELVVFFNQAAVLPPAPAAHGELFRSIASGRARIWKFFPRRSPASGTAASKRSGTLFKNWSDFSVVGGALFFCRRKTRKIKNPRAPERGPQKNWPELRGEGGLLPIKRDLRLAEGPFLSSLRQAPPREPEPRHAGQGGVNLWVFCAHPVFTRNLRSDEIKARDTPTKNASGQNSDPATDL